MADELAKRLAGLAPEQRELLLRRLKKEGLAAPGERPADEASSAVLPPFALDAFPEGQEPKPSDRQIRFSLLLLRRRRQSMAESYELLLESARFADATASPRSGSRSATSRTSAASTPTPRCSDAAIGRRRRPARRPRRQRGPALHKPERVAEVGHRRSPLRRPGGLSFAGWNPGDFALRPEGYADRRELMFRGIETVRSLWRGGGSRSGSPARPTPRPGRGRARSGANALTIVQPLPSLAEKIGRYRAARAERGFDGTGRVTVMVHAFVGDDEEAVRAKVRAPMTSYLRTYFDQYGFLAQEGPEPGRESDVEALLAAALESSSRPSPCSAGPTRASA